MEQHPGNSKTSIAKKPGRPDIENDWTSRSDRLAVIPLNLYLVRSCLMVVPPWGTTWAIVEVLCEEDEVVVYCARQMWRSVILQDLDMLSVRNPGLPYGKLSGNVITDLRTVILLRHSQSGSFRTSPVVSGIWNPLSTLQTFYHSSHYIDIW